MARYYMHKQVYFHKTRIAYDFHLQGAMKSLLPGGQYPPPTPEGLGEYLKWDDWRVLGLLAEGKGGEHGARLLTRKHYRLVYQTRDNPTDLETLLKEEEELKRIKEALGEMLAATRTYTNTWYKQDTVDIPVVNDHDPEDVRPLSEYSLILRNFAANKQDLLYVKPEDAAEAKDIVNKITKTDYSKQLKMEFSEIKRKEVASAS
jgi:HD superfamily phosphohydrolase